ncbi:MAG: DUF11 domain-containing protein, partial [Sporichthyaceae bacterium]|nr:DUF11 domain-containing protein [Sporichthyaceae bacterium]
MVRSLIKRGMPKPFAILLAALMALYVLPLGALPASAADVGGFEIEGNLIDDTTADPPIDWFDLGPGSPGFSTGVDNTTTTGQDDTTFQGSSKEFDTTGNGAWPNWDYGSGNATGKSDFGRWATYDYVDSQDHVWFYFAFDRGFGTGTAKYAFELNQITQSPTTDANPDRSQGDIRLIIYDQGNGLVTLTADAQNPDVGLYVWDDPDQPAGGVAEDTDKDGSWVKITNAGIFAGASNTGETPVAVPSWWTGGNVEDGTLTKDTFLEFGIDLTSFGAVLGCPSAGFSAVNARSITGTGGPGTLVDYLEAIPVTIPSNCAALFIRKFQGNGETPLGGATFEITPNPLPTGSPGSELASLVILDDSDGNTTVEPGTNYDDPDPDAGEISLPAVKPGIEYTVTEVAAPDGWIKDNSSVKVTPVAYGTSQSPSNTARFVNHRGAVTFYKDYEGADPETGASFTLTRDNDDADALYNNGTVQVTDNGANDSAPAIGVITVAPLEAGSWKLVEDMGGAPTGWIRDNTEIFFTVPDAMGNRDVTLANPTLSDPRRTYPLTVRKVAEADNSVRINGAVFDLYKETSSEAGLQLAGDTKVGTCTTSGNGECSVTDLAWGASYYWYEVSVPAPYNLPSNRVVGPIALHRDGSSDPSGTAVFQDPQSAIRTQATNGSLPNATISDTAYVTGVNDSNTGGVTFYVYGPLSTAPVTSTSCGYSVVEGVPNYESGPNYLTKVTDSTGVKNAAGEWVYETGAVAVPGSGNFAWVAVYRGDNNGNRSVAGTCGDANETSNVPAPRQPVLSTQVSATSLIIGSSGSVSFSDKATLSGASDTAGGTITFRLFGPGATVAAACATTGVVQGSPVAVSGNGTYQGPTVSVSAAGYYSWVATYSGDGANLPATHACGLPSETVQVFKGLNPTLDKIADPPTGSTVQRGDAVKYTVTVGNTGDVAIDDGVVTDTLPAYVTVDQASVTASGGTFTAGSDRTKSAGTIKWTVDLAPGQTKSFVYNVTV